MLAGLQDDATVVAPNFTVPDVPRLLPVRVTLVPTGPADGEIPLRAGSVADVTVKEVVSADPPEGVAETV